jgi:hypothetical protein
MVARSGVMLVDYMVDMMVVKMVAETAVMMVDKMIALLVD